MDLSNNRLRPSFIWMVAILFMIALAVVLLLSGGSLPSDIFDSYVFAGAMFLPLFALLFFAEFKFIYIEPDCVCVRNCLGIKRTVHWERVSKLQIVKKKETYYLLITLDGHPTFGGYKQDVLLYAWCSPIKVIHLVIPGKKRREYFELIRRVYPKAVYLNCDGVSKTL